MNMYLCLLRGINVSGQKIIKMAHLRELLEIEGFVNVRTYIQSGNILLESEQFSKDELNKVIENFILKEYGWEVPCLVLNLEDLKEILANNPFPEQTALKANQPYVCIPQQELSKELLYSLDAVHFEGEYFKARKKAIYLYSTLAINKSKLSNHLFEKKLNMSCTTRNWRTLTKLYSMMDVTLK